MSWSDIFKKKTEEWFYGRIPAEQTPNDIDIKEVVRDDEYINIFLKSMRVGYSRKGLSTYYGAVHSYISLLHRGGKPAKFNAVTTPASLEQLDAKRIYNVVNFNKPLLDSIPYRGGNIDLEIGLFSIKTSDLARPFISLLTEMSNLAGVTFISAALPYAASIEKGINLLAGATEESSLEIGISTTYNKIETGYYAVVKAPKNELDVRDIRIGPDFSLTDKDGGSLSDYPYIVFQIFSTKRRDNWFDIPEIAKSYQTLQEDVNKANYANARESLLIFRRSLYTSNDLLRADAEKIFEQVNAETTPLLEAADQAVRSFRKIKKLKNLNEFLIYD
jgi:hypothetical protein